MLVEHSGLNTSLRAILGFKSHGIILGKSFVYILLGAFARSYPYSVTPTTMSNLDAYDLRAKYTHFRILVIGRANAGKTTLLQRVCNTTEDPCIYDNDTNLVSLFINLKMNSASDFFN
jgi:hypothetical protein